MILGILLFLIPVSLFAAQIEPVETKETKIPVFEKGVYPEGEYESEAIAITADDKTVGVALDAKNWPTDPKITVFVFLLESKDGGKTWVERHNAYFPGGTGKNPTMGYFDNSKDARLVKTIWAVVGGAANTAVEIVTKADVKK